MPFINVKQLSGRTDEQNAEITRALTEAYARVTGVDPEKIWVAVEEIPPTHWSAGGETFAVRKAKESEGA
ncbi:4-oxalocrotonate tautomerase family protein [Kitasatospora sp. NPDC048540]|uniref:tautomerase family protein n=1 Tax=unclassified Kitasatospora TaxID=2633591 RepID=UPI00053A1FA9|nr:4-oxalocrotonate tautomerase family protein [Kitasatospora sp. MBT63]